MNTMTNQLTNFTFNTNTIRVITIEGEPWFVGSDIRSILGIAQSGTNFSSLDISEVHKVDRTSEVGPLLFADTRAPKLTLISESGLYKIVMRSDKPQAKPFQDWVTKAVLPAIRKDGGYILGEEKVVTGEMSEDDLILKAMEMQQNKIKRLREGTNTYPSPAP